MPPDRGRAPQACTACRKQKTRCYAIETPGAAGGCWRCEKLRLACSLGAAGESGAGRDSVGRDGAGEGGSLGERLERLERVVNTVVQRLDGLVPTTSVPGPVQAASLIIGNRNAVSDETVPPETGSTAPVFVIRDVAREMGASPYDQQLSNASTVVQKRASDIIDSGMVEVEDAASLLTLFLEHYGRWVAFPETTLPATLLAETRKSPLLLCACCLIAVRHTTLEYASKLAPQLFQEAKSLLSTALLVVPQTIEFFQAALVLCLWSTTIGQEVLSIDSWLVSGFALQHCLSSDLFAMVTDTARDSALGRGEIRRAFIWNHLCLAHLHYCVGTRRKAILDRQQVEKCRRILESAEATNFETRMVSEINLYWIIYESCSLPTVDVPATQALLNSWRQEWKYLFDQPRPQFVQMGFHFAQLLVYEKALKSRSASVRESLLSEMVRLSAAILTLAMDTADIRTQHLTDHIYHVITFAAVTLCRLLHMYEHQLARSHDIPELDRLILKLVTWLHSIGLPSHVAHTLGDVVSAFHAKLRPEARPTPAYEADPWAETDFALFAELQGAELFYDGSDAFFPDWEPFIQGPVS